MVTVPRPRRPSSLLWHDEIGREFQIWIFAIMIRKASLTLPFFFPISE
jgi:hypothetical protein